MASTDTTTYYAIHPKRGAPAMKDMGILDEFKGYAVHDHWASYSAFDCFYVLCNAHHLRELIHAHEQYEQQWSSKMIDCLLEAKAEVDATLAAGKDNLSKARGNYSAASGS